MKRYKTRNDEYTYRLVMLYEYMSKQEARYFNDVVQLSNNVQYRDADPLDHLEMIMAQTRLSTAMSVFDDIRKVINGFR